MTWSGALRRARTGLGVVALLNLGAAILYLWALSYQVSVEVRLEEDGYSAQVEGGALTISATRPPQERALLLLEEWPPGVQRGGGCHQSDLLALARRIGGWLGPAWVGFEAEGETTAKWGGPPLQQIDSLQVEALGSDTLFRADGTASLRASLVRGWGTAALAFIEPASGDGYLFWFHPYHQAMGWDRVEAGQREKTMASADLRLPFSIALAATLVSVLTSFFLGWVVLMSGIVLAIAIAPGVGSLLRRLGQELTEAMASPLWRWGLALALAAGGLLLSVAAATFLLRRIPHVQDSVTYLFQAQTLALGRLYVPPPPLPEFFQQEFILNFNGMWFGKYPLGHPAVLALGVLAGVPWLVGPLLGAGFILLLFWLGRELYGVGTGLLAATLAVLSPFFIFLSASFMAHPTSLFFVALFLVGFARTIKGGGWGWPLLAGSALGLAFLTRPLTAASIAIPFVIYALADLFIDPGRYLRRYPLMALGGLLLGAIFFGHNWVLTGHPLLNPHQLWWSFDRIGFGPQVGMYGHTPAQGLVNTWHNLTQLQEHLFGWPPYLTLALFFLPFASLRARPWDWLLLAGGLSLTIGHLFYWADGIMFGPRYYYEALPMLALLTARGLMVLVELIAGLGSRRLSRRLAPPQAWRPAAVLATGLILAALLGYNLLSYLPGQIGRYRNYNYVNADAQEAIRAANLGKALVFVEDEPQREWWRYGQLFSANTPLLDSEVIYARDLGEEPNRELMAAFPDRSYYRWDGLRLEPLPPLKTRAEP